MNYYYYYYLGTEIRSRQNDTKALSQNPIPLELREQFGLSLKNSLTLDATYDTTQRQNQVNCVPVKYNYLFN